MNANHIRVLMGCAGCIIGATAFGAAPVDGPSQAVLASYSFQPQVFGDPAPAVVSPSGSVALIPLIAIAPAAQPEKKPAYHDFRSLEEACPEVRKIFAPMEIIERVALIRFGRGKVVGLRTAKLQADLAAKTQ